MPGLDVYDLSGQVAVVTGAGSGIGRATAVLLSEVGARVICADLNGPSAAETATAITDAGGLASGAQLDVTDRAAVDSLLRGAVDDHGHLDVLVNVAGIIIQSLIVETTEAELDRVWATNFKGVFFGCQTGARIMSEAGRGRIINMVSAAIDQPAPGLVCYSTAKVAVTQLTKTLAVEVGPHGVRVNAVAPGFIETPMTARHFTAADGTIDEARRQATLEPMIQQAPLRRVGQASEIAHAVLYLASEASGFVTGQILRPNGGVAMPW